MKKLLFLFFITFSQISFAQFTPPDCEGHISSGFRQSTDQYVFSYNTPTLLNGTPQDPITPTSGYTKFKFEFLHPNGNVLYFHYVNPENYFAFHNGNYVYQSFFNPNCYSSGLTDSPGVSLKVTIINYIPWYFGGILQNTWLESPFQSTCTGGNLLIDCDNSGGGIGEPNLTWGNVTVTVAGTTYNVNNGQTPVLKKNNWADFKITVNNDDDGNAGSFACLLLVSSSNDAYPNTNGWPVYNFQTANFNSIAANSSGTTTISNFIGEFIGGLNLVHNQTYHMYLDIDYDDSINYESNENDNITVFPFKYNDGSSGRVAYLDLGYGLIEVPLDNAIGETNKFIFSYNLKIYNLFGRLPLVDQAVQNGQTINVSFLPSGTYVVHINNIYVKKFKKLGKIVPFPQMD